MGFRVGRQHPLHFTDQPRVPAARPSDKTDTISRPVIQGGFENFPNLLVVLRTDCAVRLIHLGLLTGSDGGGAHVKRKGATYNSGSSWPQVSFSGDSQRRNARLGADHSLACLMAKWRRAGSREIVRNRPHSVAAD